MFHPELPPARLASAARSDELWAHARHHGRIALHIGFHLCTALLSFCAVTYLMVRFFIF